MNKPRFLTSEKAVCVWIPLFPIRMEERRRPELVNKSTAILSPTDTRKLWLVSAHARRFGVEKEMTVSRAIGLCASLTLLEPDPVFYDEQFSRLLMALAHVSPVVVPVELGRAYVGVDGLERLYGGPEQQLAIIAQAIERMGGGRTGGREDGRNSNPPAPPASPAPPHDRTAARQSNSCAPMRAHALPCNLGYATGKFAAWVAASRAKPGMPLILSDHDQAAFLAEQPVGLLPVDPSIYRKLWLLGVRTLKQLAALPQEAVVSQFGAEGRIAWRMAAGKTVEPVVGEEAPTPIASRIDFPVPIADFFILGHALDQLIDRTLRHPRRIGWRVHVVRVRAELEHGASWMTEVTLRDPTAARVHIAAPLKNRLELAPPTGGVNQLSVEFRRFARGTSELQLFARDSSSAARAGRRRALRWAAHEIKTRFKQPYLHQVIEVHPWSRIPERRYALIDYEP